jgi:predicted oxidoreductase (fatty acid repression mutant protein)
MKSSNSAFNAQDSRVTIVAQVRTVKIYVAVVEAIRKKGMKLSLSQKKNLMVFSVSPLVEC